MSSICVTAEQFDWLKRPGGSASDRLRFVLERWRRGELGNQSDLEAITQKQGNEKNALKVLSVKFKPEYPPPSVRAMIELAMMTPVKTYDAEIREQENFIASFMCMMTARTVTDHLTGIRYIPKTEGN